ncbi:MAG: histidine phosphatase family protein [Candidatus Chisholmbacteria bacterium]|nr:histidine phosphatase family protein [Candidatus Chisholmbacteria bacterium]
MASISKRDCTIYLVRHVETKWNVRHRLQGHGDSPITRRGRRQARKMGRQFKHIHFDAVYSSDLLRAHRTAKIIAREKKLAVQTSEALRERHFGKHEGKTFEVFNEEFKEAFRRYYQEVSEEERRTFILDNQVETDDKLINRFITFLRQVALANQGKTILVVSHGGTIRAFLIHTGFAKANELRFGAIANTCYIKVVSDGVDFFVKEATGVTLRAGSK